MRVLACLVVLALAGCAQDPPAPVEAEADPWVLPDPVVLVDGAYPWHPTSSANPAETIDIVGQMLVHPCLWEDPSGAEEPYFNNLHLPTSFSSLPPWSGNLTVTFDWTDADWLGEALRIAYRVPGTDDWKEAGPITSGTMLAVPIDGPAEAGPDEDEDEDEESAALLATEWSLWVCVEGADLEPTPPFAGSVTVRADFAADPMPASLLALTAPPEGRTARSD